MTTKRKRAFTLMHTLLWVTLLAMITTLGTYLITRSLRIQSRVSVWSNDDAVAGSLLLRLRQDTASARDAAVPADAPAELLLRNANGEIRYRSDHDTVERTEPANGGPPVRHVWRFGRSSVRWLLEVLPGGGKVVWARVEMLDPVDQGAPPVVHRYATAWRVGTNPLAEGLP